uniref:Protein FAR1-RELATED SEQUENCE n=1 Tax=Steinernema glaseri TaxID=37863 RepID=A0A1I7YHE3_9BILA
MNSVPLTFFEQLFQLLHKRTLSKAKELAGNYGQHANYAYEHISTGSDRRLETLEEIESASRKFVRKVTIHLNDAEAGNVARNIVQRFSHSMEYNFGLGSSSITEAWVALAYSLKRLGSIWIKRKLDDDALKLLQKLVTGRKLWYLMIHPDAYEDGMYFSVLEQALKVCSKEECDFIAKKYRAKFVFERPSCIYKFEEQNGGSKRRFYMAFECASHWPRQDFKLASYNGHNDLDSVRITPYICIMFA